SGTVLSQAARRSAQCRTFSAFDVHLDDAGRRNSALVEERIERVHGNGAVAVWRQRAGAAAGVAAERRGAAVVRQTEREDLHVGSVVQRQMTSQILEVGSVRLEGDD